MDPSHPAVDRLEQPIFYVIYALAAGVALCISAPEQRWVLAGEYAAGAIAIGVIEWSCSRRIDKRVEFPVRRPGVELALVLVPALVGSGLLCAGHITGGGLFKIAALPFLIPIIPFIALLAMKYRLSEFGFLPHGVLLAPVVYGLSFGAACITIPGGPRFLDAPPWELLGILLPTIFTAAIPEEFFRLVCYTRLRPFLKSTPVCLLIAAVLWSAPHFPGLYAKDRDALDAAGKIIKLLPTGLLWGYLTHRTGSLWPAILVHMLPRPIW